MLHFVSLINKAATVDAAINLEKVPIVDFGGPDTETVCFRELNGNVIGYGFANEVCGLIHADASDMPSWPEAVI